MSMRRPADEYLPDDVAADERAHRVRDVLAPRCPRSEIARAVGRDLRARESRSGSRCRRRVARPLLRQLVAELLRQRDERRPVGAADRELERVTRAAGEARCDRSCTETRRPGYELRLLADDRGELVLGQLALPRVDHRDRQARRVLEPPPTFAIDALRSPGARRGTPRHASTRRPSAARSAPTAVGEAHLRRLWSCDGTNSCGSCIAVAARAARGRPRADDQDDPRRARACARASARRPRSSRVEARGRPAPPSPLRASCATLSICAQRAGASVIASMYEMRRPRPTASRRTAGRTCRPRRS